LKYKKVTKDDVFRILASVDFDCLGRGPYAINIKNTASLLNTSRYQVKKYIDELVKDGLAQLKCIPLDCEDFMLPYWGYRVTAKGRDTDYYKSREQREVELIEELLKDINSN
jgi:predicted ArsR family transcriptional regulator